MPAKRLPMRHVGDVLRLKHACGMSDRVIARSLGAARLLPAEVVQKSDVEPRQPQAAASRQERGALDAPALPLSHPAAPCERPPWTAGGAPTLATVFLLCSRAGATTEAMQNFRDQLAFSIGLAVARSRELLRRILREHVTDEPRAELARRVRRELEQSGYEVDEEGRALRQKPPTKPHG